MPKFRVTYHAGGQKYGEELESDTIEAAEEQVRQKVAGLFVHLSRPRASDMVPTAQITSIEIRDESPSGSTPPPSPLDSMGGFPRRPQR